MQKWAQSVIIVVFQLRNSVFSGVDDFHRESVFFFCHALCIWVEVCWATGTLSLNVYKAMQLKSFFL